MVVLRLRCIRLGKPQMTAANRGKWAEGEVKKELAKRSAASSSFAFYRLPDARAGSLQATLADYLVLVEGCLVLLEVKEVAHDYRLSYTNFSSSQVARQRLWEAAGAVGLVAVAHSTTKSWRVLPLERFTSRDSGASWDLRDSETSSLSEGLQCQLKNLCQKKAPNSVSGSI